MNTAEVMNAFCRHTPNESQAKRYEALNDSAQELAFQMLEMSPPSRERSTALRKLQEATWWAQKAIAVNEVDG